MTKYAAARVEFLSIKPEVESLIANGHTAKDIHKSFLKEKRISMSYRTFASYVRGKDKHHKKSQKIESPLRQSPPILPKSPTTFSPNKHEDSSAFIHDSKANLHNAFFGDDYEKTE